MISVGRGKFMAGLETEIGPRARHNDEGVPGRYVEEEQRSYWPDIGFPGGLGAFGL